MKMKYFLTAFVAVAMLMSCNKKVETEPKKTELDFSKVEIQDFIWKGLNSYYFWKDDITNLANSKIDDKKAYFNFLNSEEEPSAFFEKLLNRKKVNDRPTIDKWSWIVSDYVAQEKAFDGISRSNGIEYGLTLIKEGSDDIIGFIRYVLPNSNASDKDIKRGDIFNTVNGKKLTINNYRSLLFGEELTYTLGLADLINGEFKSNGKSVTLTKSEYHENPIFIDKVLEVRGKKIGYLMYNSFTGIYDEKLNDVFAKFKGQGVTDLVLDLRYNGGGSVRTASYLCQMITGQFTGQLLLKERWNNDWQNYYEKKHPDWIQTPFTSKILKKDREGKIVVNKDINSLMLDKLYVITSGNTASASELIINGLNPYINVIKIGTKTHGKYVASITLYDSDNFSRKGANKNHTWAMQPIVLETLNKNGLNDKDGFDPDYKMIEYIDQMKPLGNINEPLLAKAISLITGIKSANRPSKCKQMQKMEVFSDSKEDKLLHNEMYIEKDFSEIFNLKN